jgi:hypothetical protein
MAAIVWIKIKRRMESVRSVLKLALRAAVWRTTPELSLAGLLSLLGCAAALVIARIALEFVAGGAGASFNPYGLNAVIAWSALDIAVAALFVAPAVRTTALSALLVLTIIAEFASGTLGLIVSLLSMAGLGAIPGFDQATSFATFALVSVWWVGAVMAVLRSISRERRVLALVRAMGLSAALLAVGIVLPHAPVFVPRDFDIRSANLWELLVAQKKASETQTATASLDKSQAALLKTQVASLSPSAKDGITIYGLGVDGWADQDVFLKELDGGLAVLGDVLPLHGRVVRLVNNRETQQSLPIANRTNFAAAVEAVGAVMNKDDDVLVVFITSHGTQSGVALRLPTEAMSELTPQDVAGVLDGQHIKNRLIIVSACFAGIFVPPLANDNTIILTAADAQHTSFGCNPERDWTYFGDALFRQSLRPGSDFEHAFENARLLIHGWELMDRVPASNPQAHFGPALVAKLKPLLAVAASSN